VRLIDTKDISASDPRNPKRVVFQGMELFSSTDIDGKTAGKTAAMSTRVQATHSITHTVEDIDLGFVRVSVRPG